MWRAMIVAMVSMCLLVCSPAKAVEWRVGEVTDTRTDLAKTRVGVQIKENIEGGLTGTWFSRDAEDPSKDWGIGVYGKFIVDPNVSVPVAGWLPKIGDWFKLPESLQAQGYLIGEVEALPYDGGTDFRASIGPGLQIGPAVIEYLYGIVESGTSGNPALSSGATVYFGLEFEF